MAKVVFKDIKKAYGPIEIIKGVDLEVQDKEFLVLVGPSGCGKSTLLRLIAGLEEITSGDLSIGDEVVNTKAPSDRDIAMVFQSYALYPHMTVYDNIAFGLKIRKMPKDEIDKRVREAAKIMEIEEYLDRFPKNLSGGQRQRVAIGRAIVRRPKVFLFDEPLSNLDAALRSQMRVELKKLHKSLGVTMVYVTHDQIEAMTLADRITVLKAGLVQQVGTPYQLYNSPANKFVAGFIGSPAMNFIPASCFLEGDTVTVAFEGLRFPKPADSLWEPRSHEKVTLGIRPTDIGIGTEDEGHRASVLVSEPLGFEILVHVMVGDVPLLVQAPAEEFHAKKRGDKVNLTFDPARMHLFHHEDENALTKGVGG